MSGPGKLESVVGFGAMLAGLLSGTGEDISILLLLNLRKVVNSWLIARVPGATVTTAGKLRPGPTIRRTWIGIACLPYMWEVR